MTGTSDLVTLGRVTGSLVVVLVVAVLAARLARRVSGRAGQGMLAVRDRIGLTRDASAVVLEVGGRRLLLGVSAQQVSLLADLGADGVGEPVSRRAPDPGPQLLVTAQVAPAPPLTRRELRTATSTRRRPAIAPVQRGTGSVVDPRTWQQGLEALRDLTARRG